MNAFARKKDCWNEPTNVLDKVAFATVRTVRACEVAKIGVNLRVVLDKFALALDPATILVKADWINEVILLLCMGYRNEKTGFMNFVCWYVTVLWFRNDENPDSLLENEVNTFYKQKEFFEEEKGKKKGTLRVSKQKFSRASSNYHGEIYDIYIDVYITKAISGLSNVLFILSLFLSFM